MAVRDPLLSALIGFIFAAGLAAPVRASDSSPVHGMTVVDPVLFVLALVLGLRIVAISRSRSAPLFYEYRARSVRIPFKYELPARLVFVIAVYLFVSIAWSADPRATGLMAGRVLSFGLVYLYAARRVDASWCAAGGLFSMGAHAALLLPELTESRQAGLAATVTVLGMTAVWPGLIAGQARLSSPLRIASTAISAVMLAAAGSRAPLFAATGLQLRSKRFGAAMAALTLAVFVLAAWQRSELDRLTNLSTIETDARHRAATVKVSDQASIYGQLTGDSAADDWITARAGESSAARFTWLGYGFDGFDTAVGWPRPHNAFMLLVFELGLVAILVPVLVAAYLVRARSWASVYLVLVFAAWALLDESMLSAEGFYGFGLAILVAVAAGRSERARTEH